jgi:four helix bundle protein
MEAAVDGHQACGSDELSSSRWRRELVSDGPARLCGLSAMHNIAEGFDGGSNPEFVRFLRYAQRSCTEVKSQLYAALDQEYISKEQFDRIYDQATVTHQRIGGFIRYLTKNGS